MDTHWNQCRIGITGASGAFGQALTKKLRAKGAFVIGITHSSSSSKNLSTTGPQKWVFWECGKEEALQPTLASLDILVLNHGINPQGRQSPNDLNAALTINAFSTWKLIEQFEQITQKKKKLSRPYEIWINTSEAEVQPALSPGYEISKRLIGQLISIRWSNLNQRQREKLRIRKLVFGPFQSELNPIGIMNPEFVANQTIMQAELGLNLIIVTPNPITYIVFPLNELFRSIYYLITKKLLASN